MAWIHSKIDNSKMKYTPLLLALSVLLVSARLATAQAQVVTSTSTVAPSDGVIWSSQPDAGSLTSFNWNSTPARRDIAISFQAPATGGFSSFTLQAGTATTAGGVGFTLRIYETTNPLIANPTSATPKGTFTGVLPEVIASNNYLSFDLGEEISITASRYYLLLLSMDVTSTQRSLGILNGTGSTIASQFWYSDAAGTNFTRSGTAKAVLYVQQVTSIPEPGVTALLGMSGLLLLGWMVGGKRLL